MQEVRTCLVAIQRKDWNIVLKSEKSVKKKDRAHANPVIVLLRNVSVSLDDPSDLRTVVADRTGLPPERIRDVRILRRALDARRKKTTIRYVHTLEVETDLDAEEWKALGAPGSLSVAFHPADPLETAGEGEEPLAGPPVVVGAGPAGLFCALGLARMGYGPLLMERGRDVSERRSDIRSFFEGRRLDPESNLLFGAGGAGFFSDGKLTAHKSTDHGYAVLRLLAEHGAPGEILYLARPHIGTEGVRECTARLLGSIREAGGEVHFGCRFEGFAEETDGSVRLRTTGGELRAGALVLALGGSARDTFDVLVRDGLRLSEKPFQMGLRLENPQAFVNRMQYGRWEGHPKLPPAEYRLSARVGEREGTRVFTFCMCPGGIVVPVASEPGGVASNGASPSTRDGEWANAALMVTVSAERDGAGSGVALQREVEEKGFRAGGADYALPAQPAADFVQGLHSPRSLSTTSPTGARYARLGEVLPPRVSAGIRRALEDFEARFPGMAGRDAVLLGPETRGSSPVRMDRDPETRTAAGCARVYPVGEGAGYAGGILSAAVDGLRTALALGRRFAPPGKK
jgi:uncharacterized FAD-dependent dehydrogenase